MSDDTVREALRELVACKDLKDRGWHMRRNGTPEADVQVVEREYAERKQKAWEAARAALREDRGPAVPREPTLGMLDAGINNDEGLASLPLCRSIWRAMYDAAPMPEDRAK
jgi:hypothetical protein